MSKPSIIFVTGSFSVPALYDSMFEAVRARGYEIQGFHHLTAGLRAREGRPGEPPTMYDDAAALHAMAEKLADEGKDVILVSHSYGGVPVSECTKGVSKIEREQQGKKGGIIHIAYMTSVVPAIGESLATAQQSRSDIPIKILDNGWMIQEDPAAIAALILPDLPADVELIAKFTCHSAVSFSNELTYAGYKDIPTSYLLCEIDATIPVERQKRAIENIEKLSGKKVAVTSINAGHIPHVSALPEVVDWIVDVAEKA
ncbi:hypothetical protein HYALB_00007655 [Hymenoscyphus albidus]|uniref:AB hydrolase-1 domain-containing protein n=1 Tax=Hymenoscyphus albidus TaxID=595503 RepID=A0A9N9LE62_9HELO|nr:hypothetical protein HYALB_00007655 [Hymenoscyphus albidus]